jgi:hypothetical protein
MISGEKVLVLGRNKLRSNLAQLADQTKDFRLMLIGGPKGTGKTFSCHLIEHVARTRGIATALTDIGSGLGLEAACEHIANQMGFDVEAMRTSVLADQPTPDRIGRKFAHWLLRQTAERPGDRWWLIFDGLDEADGPSPELRDHLVYWLARALAPDTTPEPMVANQAPPPNAQAARRPQVALILLGATTAPFSALIPHSLFEQLEFLRRDAIRAFLDAYAKDAESSLPPAEIERLLDEVIGSRPEPFVPPNIQEILQTLTGVVAQLDAQREEAFTLPRAEDFSPRMEGLSTVGIQDKASLETRHPKRLEVAPSSAPALDPLDPYRAAASVLIACEPFTLRSAVTNEANRAALDLLPELVPSPYLAEQRRFPWCLPVAARKRTLGRLQSAIALRQTLAANPDRPPLLLQRMLDDAINGRKFEVEELRGEELVALATVADWLANTEIGPQLPRPDTLRQEADRQRDLATLRRLASDFFTGRQREMGVLQRHIQSREPRLLFVTGVGGTGKSALLSHALLVRQEQATPGTAPPWLRLDLDSSRILPDKPSTLLLEASEQLKRRHPDLITILQDLDKQVLRAATEFDAAHSETSTGPGSRLWEIEGSFIGVLRYALGPDYALPSAVFVLWIDTFEEAQFLGSQVALNLISFLFRLASLEPRLRVIVAGRARLQTIVGATGLLGKRIPRRAIHDLTLRGLPRAAAEELLRKLLHPAEGATRFSNKVIVKAARSLRGNPLALRLGADLLQKKGEAIMDDLGRLGAEAMQRWLYSRILEHFHDAPDAPELNQLAFPGLIVRRLTPEVIERVLAGPCGLGRLREGRAKELFGLLAKEITLLEEDPEDGSLRHRPDVRQLMLQGAEVVEEQVARAIDQGAVEYWQGREPVTAIARAEELYHRLRLGQPTDTLDGRWLPAAEPLLRSALMELPAGSPARLWLADRLRAVLEEDELGGVTQQEWEGQAAMEAERALAAGNPAAALKALRSRRRRIPGSRLDGLEARTYLFLQQPRKALDTIRRGITRSRKAAPQAAIDLLLLEAFIHERQADYDQARKTIGRASILARTVKDPATSLTVGVRGLRLDRQEGGKSLPESPLALHTLAAKLGPNFLASRPALLREVAAEMGKDLPDILQLATDHFLEDLLQPLSNQEIIDFLGRALASVADMTEALQFSQKAELIHMAHSRLSELLATKSQGTYDAALPARIAVQKLFQASVDEILNKDYGAPRKLETPVAREENFFQARPDFRQQLEAAIAGVPTEVLEKAIRLVLRTDYDRLAAGKEGPEIAHEIVERATKLGQVGQLIKFLAQVVPAFVHIASQFTK